MIFVTVGSAEKGIEFDRLIKKADEVASHFQERFLIQRGPSGYVPQNAESFRFASYEKMVQYFAESRLVIGHCGAGTVLNAFSAKVPLIAVPRMTKYGEIDRDDHQSLLARKIEKYPGVSILYDLERMEPEISRLIHLGVVDRSESFMEFRKGLFDALREYLDQLR